MKFILKSLRIMKLTVFLILLGLLRVSGGISAQAYRVNLKFDNVALSEVLDQLRVQTNLDFFYSNKELDVHRKVSMSVEDTELAVVLKELLGQGYSFRIYDRMVIIRPMKDEKEVRSYEVKGVVKDKKGIPLPGVTVMLKTLNLGTATDKDGKFNIAVPKIENRQIVLVFSFIGMKTREEVWKESKDSEKEWVIVMEDDMKQLEEVTVNTGYQRIEARNLTSAVTSLKVEDILVPGMSTIDQMLEGHVPGMIFMQNSGQVGATPRLRIRGTSTIIGNQEPLWVVDGIVQTDPVNVDPSQINDLDFVNLLGNAISGLNPEDVEQIDVLKDASATAIYGARAANGVIVITTKQGKIGTPAVTYSLTGSFSQRPRYGDRAVYMMNSEERIAFSRDLIRKGTTFQNMNIWVGYEKALKEFYDGTIDYEQFKHDVNYFERVNTDWFGIILKDAFSHNHTLSISGGTENVRYYASVGYQDQVGTIRGESNKRYTANVRVNANYKRFQVAFGLSGRVTERGYTPSDVGLLNYAYNTSRAVPARGEDGELWYYDRPRKGDWQGTYKFNILNERDNSSYDINGEGFTFNANVNYKIVDGLRLGAVLSYSTDNTTSETYYGEKTFYITNLRRSEYGVDAPGNSECPYGGELKSDVTKNKSYTARLQLDYKKALDVEENHSIQAAVGGELSSAHYTGLSKTFRGYLPDRGKLITPVNRDDFPNYVDWMTMSTNALGSLKDQLTNRVSGYFSASYMYKSLYVVNFNARVDASNKFGKKSNDRLLPIWSISGRWNVAETLIPNVQWVNDVNFRCSFGYQGNMLDSETPELIIRKGNIDTRFKEYSSIVSSFPNPYLSWEKTMSVNATLDFALFKRKLTGTISWFYKRTEDAFLKKSISEINGINKYTVNQGTLTNTGFEFSFNITPINNLNSSMGNGDKGGFYWRIDPQIGQIVNNLVNKATSGINKKNRDMMDEITYSDYLNGRVPMAGRPLNTFYSYRFKELSSEDGRPMFHGTSLEDQERYEKMDNNEDVYMAVMAHSGTRVPVLQGGISNTVGYRRFVLSFNLAYSFGSKIRLLQLYPNVGRQEGTIAPNPLNNVRKEFAHRWKRPGDEKYTNIPAVIENTAFVRTLNPWWGLKSYSFASNIWNMYDASDLRVVSGNYLKMQSLSLRYNIPERLCRKVFLKSAYFSVTGSNLFTIASRKLKGQEPTQSGTSSNINLSLRPTWACTANITF